MRRSCLAKVALVVALSGLVPATSRTEGRPDGVRFVPDVPGQFRALTELAEPLGFHIVGSPNPKIEDGQQAAAIAFLKQAIDRLQDARSGGADVTTLIALLQQVIAALSVA